MPTQADKLNFFHSPRRYFGQVTQDYLGYNANLQKVAQGVSHIIALESEGKISPEKASQEIKRLWKQFKNNHKKAMAINTQNFNNN